MSVPWTVISINWSVGKTSYTVFNGSNVPDIAKEEFEASYPGEVVLALVRGNHESSTATYTMKYLNDHS